MAPKRLTLPPGSIELSRMSDYLDPKNDELLKDFFEEAQMQVDVLEQNILVLEGDPNSRDSIDEIFRAAHTLKGGAATVEMTELSTFTHLVEDVLDGIREGKATVTEKLVNDLLAAIDVIKRMLEERRRGSVFKEDTTPIREALSSLLGPQGKSAARAGRAAKPAAAGKKGGISEYELLELRDAAGPKGDIYRASVSFDEANPMNSVGGIQVYAALRDVGTVLKSIPDFDKLSGDDYFPKVQYFLVSSQDAGAIEKTCTISDVTTEVKAELLQTGKAQEEAEPPRTEAKKREAPPAGESVENAQPATAEEKPKEEGEKGKAAKPASASMLRVESRRIDDLLNLVSEAVINKAGFNQVSLQYAEAFLEFQGAGNALREGLKELFDSIPDQLAELQGGRSPAVVRKDLVKRFGALPSSFDAFEKDLKAAVARFRNTTQNLARITGELQEAVMRIRMVPISSIFSRFPRLVRDLSKSLEKNVELAIEGEETELDKSVIEDLIDPLIHCVRNSLDHGIETPSVREKAGKAPTGRIRLAAHNEGNQIVIDIQDDGKGIDVAVIQKKAVERGLIHPSKTLSDVEAFHMIFDPGFSTAAKITDISGRGVGLDVVKKHVEKLNGSVHVDSVLGAGSTFTIRLPLTLAIIQGMLVRVGREIYAIPINAVVESIRLKPPEIKMIDGYEVFNVREDVLSLLRLSRLFRIPTEENRQYHFVIVVGSGDKRVGLMVDSLIGEEDLVIKPLRDRYTASPGIAGATILGDGTVALILDVAKLLEFGLQSERNARWVRDPARAR